MNLAKKGTALLAALSVFALASCGGGEQTQKLNYDEALEWIEKNYTETNPRVVTKTKVTWDYSENKPDGKLPESYGPMKDADIDALVQYSLVNVVEVEKEDAKEKTGEVEVEGTSAGDDWLKQPFNKDYFKREFQKDDALTIEATGKKLKITVQYDSKEIVVDSSQELKIKLTLLDTQTLEIGENSYVEKFTDTLTADNMGSELYKGQEAQAGTKCTLGKLNFTFTNTPVLG